MNSNLYDQVFEDATSKLKTAVIENIGSDTFDWDQLIILLIQEDSPLDAVFNQNTFQMANLCNNAKSLHQSYIELEPFSEVAEEGDENDGMERN